MFEYLSDQAFLDALDAEKLQTTYAKIDVLEFATEKVLCQIEGIATGGNINLNTNSTTRRTLSLTLNVTDFIHSDDEYQLTIDKKVRVFIGRANPLPQYQHYGDIVWFKCGTYILTSAQASKSTTGLTLSLQGKDKSAQLDGTCGGVVAAATTFDEDGDYQKVPIVRIIREAVSQYGEELLSNIYINDVPENAKMLIKYVGDSPVYFNENYSSISWQPDESATQHKFVKGEDVGYQTAPLIYTDELNLSPGATVASLLDTLAKYLGNYEWFYDLDGHFIFQPINNYLNKVNEVYNLSEADYFKAFNENSFRYNLSNSSTLISINKNPHFENIKNDFIVWGQQKTPDGPVYDIHYRLVIDDKPQLNLCKQKIYYCATTGLYAIAESNPAEDEYELIAGPSDEWREEIYREALMRQQNGETPGPYDAEMLAWWRDLYTPAAGWSDAVKNNPESLVFWLDFIDTTSDAGKYSVKKIGRRTLVKQNEKLTKLYSKEVPNIIFVTDDSETDYYDSIGQPYFKLVKPYLQMFAPSSSSASCFDEIRDQLYQHLTFNTNISITCTPKYYLEPNNLVKIYDKDLGINGNYNITQMTLPLTYNGTMSITLSEQLVRV